MRSKPSYIVLSLLFAFIILLVFQIYSLRVKLKDELHANRTKSPSRSKQIIASDKIYELIWCPELHLYRINGKPVLWFFWDKAPLPTHIKLSLATIMCHNDDDFHIQIVFEQELSAWTGDIHPAYQFLTPNHKSDYFRGRILAKYGGMYLDFDTIGLHNLKHLFAKLKEYDVVNADWWPDGDPMYTSILGPMRANIVLMRQYVQTQAQFLSSKLAQLRNTRKKYPIRWNDLNNDIMNSLAELLLNEKAYSYYKINGPKTFGQMAMASLSFKKKPRVNWTQQYSFTDTELLTYYNSRLSGQIRNMNETQFLQSDLLIASLIRFTLKRCRDNKFKDFPIERTKVKIGEDEKNIDKNLVKWIINYVRMK